MDSIEFDRRRRRFLQGMAVVGLGAAGWQGIRPAVGRLAGGQANELRVTQSGVDQVIDRIPYI